MYMIKKIFFTLMVAAVCYCATAAESTSSELALSGQLTLEKARSLALSNSRTLASLNLSIQSAEIDEKIQSYESLPSLSLSSSASASVPATGGNTVSDTISAGVSVGASQTLYSGGKNAILLAIDSLDTDIARQKARTEYFAVLDAIDSAWYSLLEAYAAKDAASSAIEVSTLALSIAEIRLEGGSISMTDYLEAEADAESKKASLSQANRDISVYSMKVASLTGLGNLPQVEQTDFSSYEALIARLASYSEKDTSVFIANLREKVLANNPALASVALARDRSEKSVEASAAAYLPTLSASVSSGLDYTVSDGLDSPSMKISLTGIIPLNVWQTKASVDSAKIAQQQAGLDLEETGRTAEIDLQTVVYDCIARSRAVVSTSKALQYAQKLYENKLEMYKLGSASVSDLSDAASLVSTNTQNLINARYDFLSGLSDIRSLCALDSDERALELIP